MRGHDEDLASEVTTRAGSREVTEEYDSVACSSRAGCSGYDTDELAVRSMSPSDKLRRLGELELLERKLEHRRRQRAALRSPKGEAEVIREDAPTGQFSPRRRWAWDLGSHAFVGPYDRGSRCVGSECAGDVKKTSSTQNALDAKDMCIKICNQALGFVDLQSPDSLRYDPHKPTRSRLLTQPWDNAAKHECGAPWGAEFPVGCG